MNRLLWAFLVGVAITSTEEVDDADVISENIFDNFSEVSGRIYLGFNASIAMFPWMVGVTQMGDNGKFETYRCGGALISRNLILTSADCVQGTRAVRVTLGSSLAGALTDADGKVTRHATLHYKRGDLCVVRLNESVTFVRDRIQPVRLPIGTQNTENVEVGGVNHTQNEGGSRERIVNGMEAQSGQFPWMAGVHGMADNGQWEYWRCGGALITRNLVLSTAHCVDAKARAYRVTLGSLIAGDGKDSDGKTIRLVDLIIKHGDAMLLRLSKNVPIGGKIATVRLPSSNANLGGGVTVTVSGWGGTGENNSGSFPQRLRYTRFDTITNERCSQSVRNLNRDVVCYVSATSTTCGGDSGSPVVRYDQKGVATHVAIHNAGACRIGNPSLGIRTNMHVDWINNEIRTHSP